MEALYIPAVWKGKDENGNLVWHTYDPREGDSFYSQTKKEAMDIWRDLFNVLTKTQRDFLWMIKLNT